MADLPGLTDLFYGDWEGLPLTEVKVKYADLYRQWESAPQTVRFPKGETLDEVKARAMAAVAEVRGRHSGQTILLAAHRAVNKVLIAAFIAWITPTSGGSARIPPPSTVLPGPATPGRLWDSMTPAI